MNIYRVVESAVTPGHYWVDISADDGANWKSQALFIGPTSEWNAKQYLEWRNICERQKNRGIK